MSLPDWEIEDEWEKRVCEPIIKYPLAPRDALIILEKVGQLTSEFGGMIMVEILEKLDEVENAHRSVNQR